MAYTPTLIDFEGSDADNLPGAGSKINTNLNDIQDGIQDSVDERSWQDPVKDKDLILPPGGASEGDRYIVGPASTGAWLNHDDEITEYRDTSWVFFVPEEGWRAWVEDEDKDYSYSGTAWAISSGGASLSDIEPGVVSSSTSGQAGTGTAASRDDHSHDLGGHDHSDAAQGGVIDHGNLTDVTSDQHHAKGHTWEGGDHSGTLNEASVTFASSGGHDHDGVVSTAVDHADLANVTSGQHHAQSHTWEGGDHTGTLNESTVTFNNSTGHDHDGTGSTAVDHDDLSNVSSDQHHAQSHVLDGGDHTVSGLTAEYVLQATAPTTFAFAEFDGDHADIDFTPTNYTPDATPAEAADVDDLAAHLQGIDTALGLGGGGEIHDVVGGRLVKASATSLKWAFFKSDQVMIFNDTTPVLVKLASEPTLANTANDLDSTALAIDSNYDIFLEYSSATAATLVAKKWTNATTRAVVPEMYKGQVVYDADTSAGRSRRFVGTIRMISDTGAKFEDTEQKRFISNFLNSAILKLDFPNPYTSATSDTSIVEVTFEQWYGGTGDWKVQFVHHGLEEEGLDVRPSLFSMTGIARTAGNGAVGPTLAIGYTTSTPIGDSNQFAGKPATVTQASTHVIETPPKGYKTVYPLQSDGSSGASVIYFWVGDKCAKFFGWIEG